VPESVLLAERDGATATLTLNRPGTKNALNPDLVEALGTAVDDVASDESVRVVVLTGTDGAFCSGADLKAGFSGSGSTPVGDLMKTLHGVIRAITSAPKPFIAAIDGPAAGFGCDLALACDLRVLSREGYFQEIFVKIGLMPDGGGTFFLPRIVGLGRALEYMMLGTRIDADTAQRVGLANRVVDRDCLASEVHALAAGLSTAPPLAIGSIKRAVRESALSSMDEALDRERAYQLELLGSRDLMEGVLAWSQKRPPLFVGK
jgi:enoyl-CoA hydratase/carnithine racemase